MKGGTPTKRGRVTAIAPALILVGSVLLAVLVLAGCGSSAGPEPVSTTTATPDSSFVTFDVSLSEYRGKPLMLAFMASW